MIADDEPDVRELIRQSLEEERDYEILEAADGREALRMVEATPVDLIIIDVCMPEQDGLEAIQQLRKLRVAARILAVSGAFDGLFLAAARAFGADAALAKPFRPLDLAHRADQCVHAA